MVEQHQTTRIWKKTLKKLRFIKAYTGESMVEILERLVIAELEQLKRQEADDNQKGV